MENKIEVENFNFYYGNFQALIDLNLPIKQNQITALIGPSGCGKTTFLRSINRMNDTISVSRAEGQIRLDGQNIYDPDVDVVELRQRVGMVFQRPNPFPQSIYDNVAFGPRVLGLAKNGQLDHMVKESLVDEPCSALDPVATLHVEELMRQLAQAYTIVIVTHNMQQAARASDWTGFFWLGRLVEFNRTGELFSSPQEELTEAYITGRRG